MSAAFEFIYWKLPAILCAILILFLTSHPTLEAPNLGLVWQDKIYHFMAYFGFGLTLARAVSKNSYSKFIAGIRKIVLIGICFAIFDEAHQILIPSRNADIWDALADSVGILSATGAFFAFLRRSKTRTRD